MTVGETASSSRPDEPAFVAHHFPGTGPQWLSDFYYSNFAVVHDEPDAFETDPTNQSEILPVDTAALSAAKLFLYRNHFRPGAIQISQTYPEVFRDKRFFTMGFVNDPLRVLATHYLYQRSKSPDYDVQFWQFIKGRQGVFSPDYGATRLNWQKAMEAYSFIGVASHPEQTLRRLTGQILARLDAAGTRNAERSAYQIRRWVAGHKESGKVDGIEEVVRSLSRSQRLRFWWENRIDYAMHAWAVRRLEGAR